MNSNLQFQKHNTQQHSVMPCGNERAQAQSPNGAQSNRKIINK